MVVGSEELHHFLSWDINSISLVTFTHSEVSIERVEFSISVFGGNDLINSSLKTPG